MKFMYFSIKYRNSDIFIEKNNTHFIYNPLFWCNHTCYYVGMVSVTSALHYVAEASRYQSRSSMYTQGLIPWKSRNWQRQFQLMLASLNPQNQSKARPKKKDIECKRFKKMLFLVAFLIQHNISSKY